MTSDSYREKLSRLEAKIESLKRRNQELEERNQALESEVKQLKAKGSAKSSKAAKFKLNYSVRQHQRKRKSQGQSTGRRAQLEKIEQVSETVAIYEPVVRKSACRLRRQQYA